MDIYKSKIYMKGLFQMAKYVIYESAIYPYYKQLIDLNKQERSKVENKNVNAALNLNIILSSACLVEGILEDRGKLLLGYYREVFNLIKMPEIELRRPINHFYNNIEELLHKKVSQTMGLDNFATLFETFTGKSIKKNQQIEQIYEGISTLFQFRNVIAHGRAVHAYTVDAYFSNGIEENFFGGYKKAEVYLTKKGLLSNGFMEINSSDMYFTDEISDHFSEIAEKFICAIDTYIHDSLEIGELIQENLREYNEKHHTSYDMQAYLRMRGTTP